MAERKSTSDIGASVADTKDNRKLEHSRGGVTTRDDLLDQGVPMLQGDPSEPVGPEDAAGEGPKRGDYRARIAPDGKEHYESVPIDDPEPGGPTARLVHQNPRADDIGDEAGLKGGVDTA